MVIFQHFSFCTGTCDINGVCRFIFRPAYQNSDFAQKCMHILRCIKLVDISFRDMKTMFRSKNYWYHTLDICNPNDRFISNNETNKCGWLFFKTRINEVQVCLVFIEILLCIYLNLTKNIYEILTKKYIHISKCISLCVLQVLLFS